MRRLALAALSSLLVVSLFASSAVAAQPQPQLVARASKAAQGGTLRIAGKVLFAKRATTISATATIHWYGDPSRTETLPLPRVGKSFLVKGTAAVPADHPLGDLIVEVTVTYGSTSMASSTTARIVPPRVD